MTEVYDAFVAKGNDHTKRTQHKFQANVFYRRCFSDKQIGDILNEQNDIIFIRHNENVKEAYDKLVSHDILSAPVFDDNDTFLGILSALDISRLIYPFLKVAEDKKEQVKPNNANSNNITNLHSFWKTELPDFTNLIVSDAFEFLKHKVNDIIIPIDASLTNAVEQLGTRHRFAVNDHQLTTDSMTPENCKICSQTDITKYLYNQLNSDDVHYELRALCGFSMIKMGYKQKQVYMAWHGGTVRDALLVLGEKECSVIAICDDDGGLIGDFTASDLGDLSKINDYIDMSLLKFLDLNNTNKQQRKYASKTNNDTFDTILDALIKTSSHHVWMVSANNTPIGLVTLSDIMKTILLYKTQERLVPFVFDLPGEVTIKVKKLSNLKKKMQPYIIVTRKPTAKRVQQAKKRNTPPMKEVLVHMIPKVSKESKDICYDGDTSKFTFLITRADVLGNSDIVFKVMCPRLFRSDICIGTFELGMNWISMGFGTDDYQHTMHQTDLVLDPHGSGTLSVELSFENSDSKRILEQRSKNGEVDLKERKSSNYSGMQILKKISSSIIISDDVSRIDKQLKELAAEQAINRAVAPVEVKSIEEGLNSTNHDEIIQQDAKVIGAAAKSPVTTIRSTLVLGNKWDAANEELLKQLNVKRVINVTRDVPNYFENDRNIHYMRLEFDDEGGEDLFNILHDCFEFIDEEHKTHGCTLLHCFLGISRSAFIAIAYIMHHHDLTVKEAYNEVHDLRPIAVPNLGFLRQLLEFEHKLFVLKNGPELKYVPSLTEEEVQDISGYHPGERMLLGVDNPEFDAHAKATHDMIIKRESSKNLLVEE